MFRAFLAVLVVIALTAPSARSAEIELDGQVRVRVEGEDRTNQDQEVIWFILQRTRIGMRANVSDEVDLYIQMQDSRRYGDEQVNPNVDPTLTPTINVDLHQGWAQVRKSWGGNESQLRFGRQELSYGNERIIGTVGWSNVGRSFDGLRTRSTRGNWSFDLGALRLAQTFSGAPDERPSDSNDDLFLSHNSYRFTDHDARGEFYVLYRDDDLGFYETTLGEHANGRFGRLRFDQEFAAQLGSRRGEDLEAFLFSAQVHARLHERVEFGAGFDFLSGDKDTLDTKFQAFDIRRIFSTAHKFYGLMDRAVVVAGPAGLLDPYVRLGLNGPRDLRAQIVVHAFSTQHKYFVEGGTRMPTSSAYLGTEVDGTLSFAVASRTRFEIGGALLFPGDSLKIRQRNGAALDKTAVWAYAQGIASF